MTASDYPVGFGYGAKDGTFYGPNGSIGPYHKGNDFFTPVGTSVIVNGQEIGKTGATGAVEGPHIHVGAFKNPNDGNSDINPSGLEWNVPGAVVYSTGYDSTQGNNIHLLGSDGILRVYLHLSLIEVTKGQEIGDDMTVKLTSTDQVRKIYNSFGIDVAGNDPILQKWVDDGGTDYELMLGLAPQVQNNLVAADQRVEEAQKGFVPITTTLYEKTS